MARDSLRWNREQERPFYTPGFPRSTPLLHAVRWARSEDPVPDYPAAAPLDALISDTGELAWLNANKRQGFVTVDTPRAQALIGFVRDDPRPLKHLQAELQNVFCHGKRGWPAPGSKTPGSMGCRSSECRAGGRQTPLCGILRDGAKTP